MVNLSSRSLTQHSTPSIETIISSLNNNTELKETINKHINQAWSDYNFGLEIISRVPARTQEEADFHMSTYRGSPLYQQSGESKLAMHFVDVNNIADQLLYQVVAIDNSLMDKIEKSKSRGLWNTVFKAKFNINQAIYDATQVIPKKR